MSTPIRAAPHRCVIKPSSFAWSPDGQAIVYLSIDGGDETDPIVVDRDYRYARLYWQPCLADRRSASLRASFTSLRLRSSRRK